MTPATKPTTRRTYARHRGRDIVVTIHPTWLSFRLAGTRKAFQLDVEAGYQLACKLEARAERAERDAAKKAAKKARA